MTKSTADFASVGDQVKIVRLSDKAEALKHLPSPETRRWVTRRKAQVVDAVRTGLLTIEEACKTYSLSEEEFKSWMSLLDAHGLRGLRATRIQDYRHNEPHSGEDRVGA